jgi:hypothetical protein
MAASVEAGCFVGTTEVERQRPVDDDRDDDYAGIPVYDRSALNLMAVAARSNGAAS